MGGGAQVGQVALGAITEADRHNIRGERISVDTIPLVGEEELAGAVRAVVRLPRVRLLVLAGSLMGGEIAKAVEEVRQKGLIVISLNMAGSVPDAADLVVSDPVQAGVMAVMAVADTAKFDIVRRRRRQVLTSSAAKPGEGRENPFRIANLVLFVTSSLINHLMQRLRVRRGLAQTTPHDQRSAWDRPRSESVMVRVVRRRRPEVERQGPQQRVRVSVEEELRVYT